MKRAAVIRAAPRLADLDRAATQAIASKQCSAVGIAFLTMDKANRLVPRHLATYGLASPPPPPVRLAPACRFDLGQLTGGLVTTLIAMQWTAKGRIDLSRPLGAVLPEANDEGQPQHRCMGVEAMGEMLSPPPANETLQLPPEAA